MFYSTRTAEFPVEVINVLIFLEDFIRFGSLQRKVCGTVTLPISPVVEK